MIPVVKMDFYRNISLLFLWTVLRLVFYPTTVPAQTVKFCAVGDILFDRGVRKTINERGVNYLFEQVQPIISRHDLALCNLECPLNDSTIGYPLLKRYSFRGEPASVQGLKYAGFNLTSVANNHTIDWGRAGFLETQRILRSHQILPIGGGQNQYEAMLPVLVKKNGLSFAFFGCVSYLLEAIPYLENKPAPAYAGIKRLVEQIKNIRNQVDFVVVTFHWGVERQTLPTYKQIDYAHQVIEAGANLVIGHHPHVLQSLEYYENSLIIYSLGNFVFDNNQPEQTETAIFSCEFQRGQILAPTLLPIQIQGRQPIPVNPASGQKILARLRTISKEFGVKIENSADGFRILGLPHHPKHKPDPVFYPVKTWQIEKKRIQVFPFHLELWDQKIDSTVVFHLPDSSLAIRDACLIIEEHRDVSTLGFIYAIVGSLQGKYGKQLAIFPIDFNRSATRECFGTPSVDSHTHYNPWKICAGDIDGDGNPEILVGVWKTTRYDSLFANRLFVFNRQADTIYPKWLGSQLGFPFIDFEVIKFENDPQKSLLVLENRPDRVKQIMKYHWTGFGFDEVTPVNTDLNVEYRNAALHPSVFLSDWLNHQQIKFNSLKKEILVRHSEDGLPIIKN